MTKYAKRYAQLNHAQREAVDTINGPLLVIAGPGTGKTELLSMRAANILQKTDTLPQNILCLTFTDSGANAMRERLADIIGPDAYKVAIHTFHSFGSEIINQHGEYFYHGAAFQPADELTGHEILRGIFDELDYTSPLAGKMNGDYTHLRDTMTVISELKRSGLASDELLAVVSANDSVLDAVEPELTQLFANRPSTTMLAQLVPLATKVAQLPDHRDTAPSYTPLQHTLSLSMAHAFDQAVADNTTKPITAWRDAWLEKNEQGDYVFKDRKRHAKLRAASHIYYTYLTRMEQAGLYDFDDMILSVIHGLETQPDLAFNLQEKYQYIMVDEFQDTNLAQLRVLFDLTSSPVHEGKPNIMAVGDDDQAIYSFQGAEVNNIHRFRDQYPAMQLIVLTDNYRSAKPILRHSREVITQGQQRLETTMSALGLSKELTAHASPNPVTVELHELSTAVDEYAWVADDIAARLAQGQQPCTIVVLARRHSELIGLLPYLHAHAITANYERRDNVLDNDIVRTVELIAHVAVHLQAGEVDIVDSLLPELLAHPAFAINPEAVWRLSLTSYRNRLTWLEIMATTPEFVPLQTWLVQLASSVPHMPLEQILDVIIGAPHEVSGADVVPFVSPLYHHYFGNHQLAADTERYIATLEALRTIRSHVREYRPGQVLHLADFIQYLDMYRQMDIGLTSVRRSSELIKQSIHLMTAHKSKGLEFDTVYIVGVHDSAWGERVRSRSRLISYPENLPLAPAGNTYEERLRLFYVAMTRAKRQLFISYPTVDDRGTLLLPASFLIGTSLVATVHQPPVTPHEQLAHVRTAWQEHYTSKQLSPPLRDLLAPLLETYKLSATHLNNFIDLSRGGPGTFLLNNLLRFPQAKSANAAYGTAIHTTLQRAHAHLSATGRRKPIEDVLGDFVKEMANQHLDSSETELFIQKGQDSLSAFLSQHYDSFTPAQRTELGFGNQSVVCGGARLTGSLDLVEIVDQTISVTDYKTGKPSTSWKGSSDYEKIKLHKYKQQLMFYQLLIKNSRDYSKYTYENGILQFVEPDAHGTIHHLNIVASDEELEEFQKLIQAVWHCIQTLTIPDTSQFSANYTGVLAFEHYLVDNYYK
jgi:DNA helicase-2/ATP-dependent DNA helicase PcrA